VGDLLILVACAALNRFAGGGLGGLGGTQASPSRSARGADPYASSGGMSATDFNNMDSALR
jgi:hypothetical protein